MTNEDKSPNEWRTIVELAAELGVSDRTIRRRIDTGEYEAKKEGRKILVKVDNLDAKGGIMANMVSKDELLGILRTQVTDLKGQRQQKDSQIETLQEELGQAREQSNTIILQLTRQLENQQMLLEHHQAPWYRRMFRKKQRAEGNDGSGR